MRVVFSRKGVDSAAGKCASALIGGRPVSLPIPTRQPSSTTYGQLSAELRDLSHDLSKGSLAHKLPCHLDPDIDYASIELRPQGWRGALGQVSSALSHLKNQKVGSGDLFLFWGLYRPVQRSGDAWRYAGPNQHAIWGWLHIEAVCDVANDRIELLKRYPWLSSHPHVREGWPGQNSVYVASDEFILDGRLFPGSGIFRRAFRLTEPNGRLPSIWSTPTWLDPLAGGVGLSYHPGTRWLGNGRLQSAARGQEFVADIASRPDAETWIANLLEIHR